MNREKTFSDLTSAYILKHAADVDYLHLFVQLSELKNELQPLVQMVKDGKIPAGKVSASFCSVALSRYRQQFAARKLFKNAAQPQTADGW